MSDVPPGGGRLSSEVGFRPLNVAVMTVSDSRDQASDTSGQLLADRVARDGHKLAGRALVKDDIGQIQAQVKAWIADPEVDVIISTGGTGLTGRDRTPEAVRPLFDKTIEGFETVWHMTSFQTVGLSTMQSRACAGLAGGTLIFALPGSNGACKDGWDRLIRWQLDNRHRPCNLSELISRFLES
ncbi:MAG TPA: molybdenum cofactor biosynthesis protein B [Rhizomicrobium sp.]|jgi:molybdenum cofactor biosynthesis protein B|nr:molybdenum cofactor biosynthesis protein B [Rhizomicrobium sp.]